MISLYWHLFVQIIEKPFLVPGQVWGIVPIYFGWFMNELTPSKANYRTAIQTGFAFIWASAQWLYQYNQSHAKDPSAISVQALKAVTMIVTLLVLVVGIVAFISGVRRKFPKYCQFLGHSRFAAYFMVAMFPMQSRDLDWTWDRLITILIFAVPVWLLFHVGLMPLRK